MTRTLTEQEELRLVESFQHHPPKTEARKAAHNAINTAAYAFARIISQNVCDERTREMALFAVQQARMFANQGITLDEVLKIELAIETVSTPAEGTIQPIVESQGG